MKGKPRACRRQARPASPQGWVSVPDAFKVLLQRGFGYVDAAAGLQALLRRKGTPVLCRTRWPNGEVECRPVPEASLQGVKVAAIERYQYADPPGRNFPLGIKTGYRGVRLSMIKDAFWSNGRHGLYLRPEDVRGSPQRDEPPPPPPPPKKKKGGRLPRDLEPVKAWLRDRIARQGSQKQETLIAAVRDEYFKIHEPERPPPHDKTIEGKIVRPVWREFRSSETSSARNET